MTTQSIFRQHKSQKDLDLDLKCQLTRDPKNNSTFIQELIYTSAFLLI